MKRMLSLAFFALILLLAACRADSSETGRANEFSVYRVVRPEYRETGDLVQAEKMSYSELSTAVQGAALALKSVPEDPGLASALPEGIAILGAELSGRIVYVLMNNAYLNLEGMDKTLVDSCITLTMCSIPNVDYVAIYTANEIPHTRLSSEDIILGNTQTSSTELQIRLYFPKEGTGYLSAEYRTIHLDESTSAERIVIDELFQGPENSALYGVLPEDTVPLSVYTDEGVCTVNFSEAFLALLEEDMETVRLAIYSIVNSLTCLKDVDSVRITVQNYQEQLFGNVDISQPLTRIKELISAPVITDAP